ALDAMLAKRGAQIDSVIRLKVDDAALTDRIGKRFAEQGRADDNPETFKDRLAVYNRQTLIDFQDLGYGSAISVAILLLIFLFVVV
ncbi:nucleoside monophosphate kinase, partial [Acinetobacter baumannii]